MGVSIELWRHIWGEGGQGGQVGIRDGLEDRVPANPDILGF